MFIDWSDPDAMLGLLTDYVADEVLAEHEDRERAQFLSALLSALTSLTADSPQSTIDRLRDLYESQPSEFEGDAVLVHLDDCIQELERIVQSQ